MSNLSQKILTQKQVDDILSNCGFEKCKQYPNTFWSHDFECEVDVMLAGNTLSDLISWIKRFNYEKGEQYGKIEGKYKVINGIKNLLEIN
jgi:hypothetical protein